MFKDLEQKRHQQFAPQREMRALQATQELARQANLIRSQQLEAERKKQQALEERANTLHLRELIKQTFRVNPQPILEEFSLAIGGKGKVQVHVETTCGWLWIEDLKMIKPGHYQRAASLYPKRDFDLFLTEALNPDKHPKILYKGNAEYLETRINRLVYRVRVGHLPQKYDALQGMDDPHMPHWEATAKITALDFVVNHQHAEIIVGPLNPEYPALEEEVFHQSTEVPEISQEQIIATLKAAYAKAEGMFIGFDEGGEK